MLSTDVITVNESFHMVSKAERITGDTGVPVSIVPSERTLYIHHGDGKYAADSIQEAQAFLDGILSAIAATEATKPAKEDPEVNKVKGEEPVVACHELLIDDAVGEALQGLLQALSDPKAARSDKLMALAALNVALVHQ